MKKLTAMMEKLSDRHNSLRLIGRLLIFVCVLMLATLCGSRTEAAPTASESIKDFVAATERFLDSVRRSAPWDEFNEDDLVPMDPVAQFEWYFRPLFNLGVSKDSMEREKNSFGWKSVNYEESGNRFRIVCEYANSGGREIYEGTYDPASGRLLCRLSRGVGSSRGIWENIELEYIKTDFGYVARVYDVLREVVHKLALNGDEGVVSWGEAKFDTLSASIDYPKEGRAWYEISGNRFVLQPWDGPVREYKIAR